MPVLNLIAAFLNDRWIITVHYNPFLMLNGCDWRLLSTCAALSKRDVPHKHIFIDLSCIKITSTSCNWDGGHGLD